jgi:hypothetical protein
MANWRDDINKAREDARRAREDANRLRQDARDLSRRLRDEAREQYRAERHAWRETTRGRRHGWDSHGWSDQDVVSGAKVEQTFALDGIREVQIEQTAGKLLVRACTGDETPGVTTGSNTAEPRLDVQRNGDQLRISVRMATGWLFRKRQGANTVIRLAGTIETIKTNLGAGDAQFRETAFGMLKIDVGAGTISSYSTRGRLDANVGAGRIVLHDHAGLAKCNAGTGDIVMDIAEAAEGDYVGNTGIGRTELRLPAGQRVRIRASSGIGRARVEYPSTDDAQIRARIETGLGEAIVRARVAGGAAPEPQPTPAPPARGPAAKRREAEELRVLQMLEQGRITAQEAADLIAALQGAAMPSEEASEEAPPATPEPPPTNS